MEKIQTVTTDQVVADAGRYLADARRGVTTVVLEDGHAVARLVPTGGEDRLSAVRAILGRAAQLRSRIDLQGDTVAGLIREGRRLG